jgi:catechol 2,3-dioxygenase-like lactoylglutathione lyase family enzyme
MATNGFQVTGVDFAYIPTQDIDQAVEFYGETLGLPELKRYGQLPGVEFETGNLTLAVIQSDAFGQKFVPNANAIALQVEDVPSSRVELESRGVNFVADTIDSGVCHLAFFEDPDGNSLMLHHRYAPKDARPASVEQIIEEQIR